MPPLVEAAHLVQPAVVGVGEGLREAGAQRLGGVRVRVRVRVRIRVRVSVRVRVRPVGGGRHLGGLVVGQAELVAARLRGGEGAVLLRDHLDLERAQADWGQVRARGDEVEEGAPLAWLGSGLGLGLLGLGLLGLEP